MDRPRINLCWCWYAFALCHCATPCRFFCTCVRSNCFYLISILLRGFEELKGCHFVYPRRMARSFGFSYRVLYIVSVPLPGFYLLKALCPLSGETRFFEFQSRCGFCWRTRNRPGRITQRNQTAFSSRCRDSICWKPKICPKGYRK